MNLKATAVSLNWCAKLFPSFRNLACPSRPADPRFLHELSVPAAGVNREEFLLRMAAGRSVLHFGFLDSPLHRERMLAGELLHQKLRNVARYLYGVDVDEEALQVYRDVTGDAENGLFDIQTRHTGLPSSQPFEIILLPEVLEHLARPFDALVNLRQLCEDNPGARLCVTAPNAFSLEGFVPALRGFESVHPDHYYYFSPRTLSKILSDAGFHDISLTMYSSAALARSPGLTKNGIIAECRA